MMYVVSGCPRSGTSMMMRILDSVFGRDRILGTPDLPKQPQPELTEIQQYLQQKARDQFGKRLDRAKDMNPNGYFEMAFCVRGVFYQPRFAKILSEVEACSRNGMPKICKIVSQGLANSDPRYISRIIYMVRDPRAVAKSQERLGRNNPMTPEMAPEINGKQVLIRSTQMFNQVNIAAARWITTNPVPVLLVNYDALLDNPRAELARVQEFLGDGDFSQAHAMIDQTLRRSAPEDIEGEEASRALAIYTALIAGDFAGIVEAADAWIEDFRNNPPPPTAWYCTRLKQRISVTVCKLCKEPGNPTTRNLRNNAEKRRTGWRNEPCVFECGIQGGDGLSVAESIARNHWLALTE